MNPFDEAIEKERQRDPLAEVEKETGASYKMSPGLGLLKVADKQGNLNSLLELSGDVTYEASRDEYVACAESEGFEIIYSEMLTRRYRTDMEPEPFEFVLLFHRTEGSVITYNTYWNGQYHKTNEAKLHYNLRAPYSVIESGHCRIDGIIVGDHYVRDSLRHILRNLRQYKFVTPWVERPHLYFPYYGNECDEPDFFKRIERCRREEKRILTSLPDDIKKALAVGD